MFRVFFLAVSKNTLEQPCFIGAGRRTEAAGRRTENARSLGRPPGVLWALCGTPTSADHRTHRLHWQCFGARELST